MNNTDQLFHQVLGEHTNKINNIANTEVNTSNIMMEKQTRLEIMKE